MTNFLKLMDSRGGTFMMNKSVVSSALSSSSEHKSRHKTELQPDSSESEEMSDGEKKREKTY